VTLPHEITDGGWLATMRVMSAAKPKVQARPKAAPSQEKRPDFPRGFPGTDDERAEKRNQFAKKHRETLRRLGK
jgi:hypothetical protein